MYQRIDHIQWLVDQENRKISGMKETERLAFIMQLAKNRILADRKKATKLKWKKMASKSIHLKEKFAL